MIQKNQRTLGELLRHHRLKASLKQSDLAEMLGYDNSHISRLERNERLPTEEYLQQFIQELFLPDTEAAEIIHLYEEDSGSPVDLLSPTHKLMTKEDWGEAPDVYNFYGRAAELAHLKKWITQERCRVVAVLGIGGQGKTSLVTKLAEMIHTEFDYVIWRSLRNAPLPADILREYLQFFSDTDLDLPEDVGGRLAYLVKFLQAHRCLLILDNVESVFRAGTPAGQYEAGYEAYGQFIQRLGETRHQSCLLLTSREKPKELISIEGESGPVRSFQLQGIDQATGQAILKDKNLAGLQDNWASLINRYSGNPLALKLVSETIRDIFHGQIADFLQEETAIFGGLREMLDQQFERLSPLEQDIMYWLAVERGGISLQELQEDTIQPVSSRDLLEALNFLSRRSLIERDPHGFTLQNVVMEYVTDHLIDRLCEEVISQKLHMFRTHPLIKAQSKDYIRDSQVRFVLEPVINKLLMTLGREALEEKLKQLLQALQSMESAHKPNYAGGNILDILLQIGSDLTQYTFSKLSIRQAYLRDVNLHDTDFSQANLAKSVFTDTFGSIFSVTFSPDGHLLAAGTTDNQIHLWRMTDGEKVLVCRGHTGWVRTVAFSPDGRILASGSSDRTIRLWDVETGACLQILDDHTDRVRAVAFSPTPQPGQAGYLLASGGDDQTIKLWDLDRGECRQTLTAHNDSVRCLVFNHTGQVMASGSKDNTVRLWQTESGHCLHILEQHTNRVESVAFSGDGRLMASGSSDHTICIWDATKGHCLQILAEHTGRVKSIAFSPMSPDHEGEMLASGSYDHTVKLWDVHSGQCFKTLRGHRNWVRAIAFSPDGHTIVSGGDDKTKKIWDVRTGQCLDTLLGYTNQVWATALHPDGTLLASSSEDHIVRLWDLNSNRCLQQFRGHRHRATSVAFSPDGRLCASGSDDQTVRLWHIERGEPLNVLQGHTERVTAVAFSPDGQFLASASADQTVRLWTVEDERLLKTLEGHTNAVQSIAFSPDGRLLASGGGGEVVRLWAIPGGEVVRVLEGHGSWLLSLAFSPDGRLLATGSRDQTVCIWDVQQGECRTLLEGHKDRVWAVAFSPDGQQLVSSSEDHTIKVWDVKQAAAIMTLDEHTNRIRSVVYSPDGTLLVSASDDETIKVWDIQSGTCLHTLRNNRPYERMNITGVIGVTEAQQAVLKRLGAMTR